ncbi:insulinase family protein [Stenotrophomonas sp. ATCM1_4]|uniref:M16 family metallopeptidase n=1 Tax=Stenotrophomonas sp. ATCM1_4 TaxID=2259330 RepID=UPI0010500C73|nr:pitrilysin family protein [Stenotrophomonas sp. ATCM1_4]TDB27427.1 insulinase family protein [Stenotrophomonas sp. ATCM1_4]
MNAAPRTALLTLALSAALGGFVGTPLPAQAKTKSVTAAATVDIPYDEFTLPNGLRVLVHTDRKAPIVAVNLWYHVGSKDEPAGRSGFAHLFEHLMFNGSENAPGEYFTPFEAAGATDMNGTTNTDRTNYFENIPTTALDMALWMESDRMGHLLGAIDQKTLDEQRGVVQNEKRQGENQPYGQLREVVSRTMFPVGHPYHHTTIGSMNDLNAASLEDVKTWFRTWYGPNNTVLVLAGDIDVATAREKVARYFGDIPATPTMSQPKVDVAVLAQNGRTELEDKVPQVLVQRMWNVPQVGDKDADLLDLTSQVLGGSASSRLDERLVHRDKLVDSVSTSNYGSQLAGNFSIRALVKQGVDPARVEAVIDEELQRLIKDGPTAEELARAQTDYRAGFIRGIERIGGFGGKADALASCATFTGNPACFRESLATVASATPATVRAATAKWLGNPSHTFVVKPGERKPLVEEASAKPAPFQLPAVDAKYTTTASNVDRKAGVPGVDSFPQLVFPALQHATLKNGSKVILAERHDTPVVNISYEFAGGYSSDHGGKLGTANFASQMLDEGSGELNSLAFKARAEDLGAQLSAGAALDGSNAYLSALTENLDASVQLFANMLRAPRFDQAEIDRVKGQWLSGIAQEKARPQTAALRVLPPLLYGADHPYGMPFTGSGTEASVAAISRQDLLNYQKQWLRPEQATVIVVGDTTLAEIVPVLDKHFGDWKGEGAAPAKVDVAQVARPTAPRVFLIDQPGAVQANIYAGELMPSTRDPGAVQLEMSNEVLGGSFTSRLNMNLREDKHWSYGARTVITSAQGQRPFLGIAPVQIDKTAESAAEMLREIAEYGTGKVPATQAEVTKVVDNDLRSQPGAYETAQAVMGTIGGIVRYGRPDNWVQVRNEQVANFTPAQARDAAKAIDPNALTWVIVGDLSKIEAPVRALKLGEVTVIDADGKPVAKAK